MGHHPTAMFQAPYKCCARKLSSAIHPLFSESTDQHMPWQFRYIHAMHLRRLAGSSSALGMPKPSWQATYAWPGEDPVPLATIQFPYGQGLHIYMQVQAMNDVIIVSSSWVSCMQHPLSIIY